MTYYPGQSTGPIISKKINGGLRSFGLNIFYLILFESFCFLSSEVSYPDDELISQEVPSDAATIVQPEAAIISPIVIPQVDRTRKPINNQKPESPTIEQPELPVKPVRIRSLLSISTNHFFVITGRR